MKAIFATIIIYAFCCYPVLGLKSKENSQYQTKANKNLEIAVKEFQAALSEKDFEKLANLMVLPDSSENEDSFSKAEKREKEIAVLKQLFEDTLLSGMSFKTRLGQPKPIENINGELFSIIPQYTIVKVEEKGNSGSGSNSNVAAGEYKGTAYYVAISTDKGGSWKFWDGLLTDSFKEKFPEAGKKIRFPKIQKPDFLKKND